MEPIGLAPSGIETVASGPLAWPSWTTGAYVLMFGLIVLAFSVHLYLSKDLPGMWTRLFRSVPVINRNNIYALGPCGLGFTLFGIAMLVRGHHPYFDLALGGGLLFIGVTWLVIFWHPNWMRPPYLRGRDLYDWRS